MSQLDTAIDEALVGNDRLRYDKAAKGVLSEKKILAYILKRTIPEFASASLHDIKEPVANYDLMGIIFVYLGNNRTRDRLMHLLYLLFVKKMKSEDLLTALHDEYDIDLTAKGKEDVTTMCNLGEGLYERAMEKGLEKGIEKGIKKGIKKGIEKGIERGVEQEKRNSERKDREATLEMIKDGLSFEQIARYMKLSIEAVAEIAKQNKLI